MIVRDVFDPAARIRWKAEEWMATIREFFQSNAAHSLVWILHRLNKLAHRIAKWADYVDFFGFSSFSSIPAFVFDSDFAGS